MHTNHSHPTHRHLPSPYLPSSSLPQPSLQPKDGSLSDWNSQLRAQGATVAWVFFFFFFSSLSLFFLTLRPSHSAPSLFTLLEQDAFLIKGRSFYTLLRQGLLMYGGERKTLKQAKPLPGAWKQTRSLGEDEHTFALSQHWFRASV